MSILQYISPQIWVLLSSLIFLLYACYSDIKTAKVKNEWILFGMVLLISTSLLSLGAFPIEGFKAALICFALGFVAFHFNILGAADVKVWMVLAIGLSIKLSLFMMALSFLYAGLMGLVMAVVQKDLKRLLSNIFLVSLKMTKAEKSLPMTLPILLAWLSTHWLYFSGVLADL